MKQLVNSHIYYLLYDGLEPATHPNCRRHLYIMLTNVPNGQKLVIPSTQYYKNIYHCRSSGRKPRVGEDMKALALLVAFPKEKSWQSQTS